MKYRFAEITVKTVRLHEKSAQPADQPFKVREAGETIGIPLVDHVVVGNGKHWSFRELVLI